MGLASPFHKIASLIAQFPFFWARRKRLIISSLFVNYWAVCKEINIFKMVCVEKKKIKKKVFRIKAWCVCFSWDPSVVKVSCRKF